MSIETDLLKSYARLREHRSEIGGDLIRLHLHYSAHIVGHTLAGSAGDSTERTIE